MQPAMKVEGSGVPAVRTANDAINAQAFIGPYLTRDEITDAGYTMPLRIEVGALSVRETFKIPKGFANRYSAFFAQVSGVVSELALHRNAPNVVDVTLDVIVKQKWPQSIRKSHKVLAAAQVDHMDVIPGTELEIIIAVCVFWNQIEGKTTIMDNQASAALLRVLKTNNSNINCITDKQVSAILACRSCHLVQVKDILAKVVARHVVRHKVAVSEKRPGSVLKYATSLGENVIFRATVFGYAMDIMVAMIQRKNSKNMPSGICLIDGAGFVLE